MRASRWLAALAATLATATASLLAAGCSTQPNLLGDAPPPGVERASLEAILQDKARFAGKTVLIEGRAGGIGCADCGGILVTDKTWRLLVEPEDPGRFRIEPRNGVPVRAWGVVDVEGADLGNVELKARGVEWL